MSSYCLRCKKETPTNNTKYETKTTTTKSGKIVNRAMMTGTCGVCGSKKTKFVKANTGGVCATLATNSSEEKSGDESMVGQGATYRVDKRDISKRTYTALQEMIKHNKPGYLTFGDTKYYVSPANVSHFKKAADKGLLKKAAQVMSGERTHQDVSNRIKTKGGSLDALTTLSDILGVVGILL
jgi:Domain of unknown function (DUF5679)